jgi:tetratricopeptide (TPR) repeat protein
MLCNGALKLGQDSKEAIVIADAYHGLADFSHRLNELDKAIEQCEQARLSYEAVDKQSFVIRTRVLAVTCKVSLERYDEAKVEADDILRLFTNSENAFDSLIESIHLRRVIGFMAFKQKDYLSAEKHWQEAYNQTSLVGAPDLIASIGNNLGKVYTKMGEYNAAEQMLSEALALYDNLGDVQRWANCMDNLADLYEEMGDLAACQRTLEQAIARLEPEATMAHNQNLLQMMQQRFQKLQVN